MEDKVSDIKIAAYGTDGGLAQVRNENESGILLSDMLAWAGTSNLRQQQP